MDEYAKEVAIDFGRHLAEVGINFERWGFYISMFDEYLKSKLIMKSKQELENKIWAAMANGCQLDSDLREDSEIAVIDCANIAIEFAKNVAIDFCIDFCDWIYMNQYEFETMESIKLFELYLKSKSNEQQH